MLSSNNLETTEEIQGCSENMQRAGVTEEDAKERMRWRRVTHCRVP